MVNSNRAHDRRESTPAQDRLQVLENLLRLNGVPVPTAENVQPDISASYRPPATPSNPALPVTTDLTTFALPPAPPQPIINQAVAQKSEPSPQANGAVHTPQASTSTLNESHLPPQDRAAATEDQSFGTLVISNSGASKYLGPTAAVEWIKNVSACLSRRPILD